MVGRMEEVVNFMALEESSTCFFIWMIRLENGKRVTSTRGYFDCWES